MGVILSRYRRKKTPLEVLEGLEEEIVSLEDTRQVTLQRQKKIVGHLIIYSVLIYVISALVFYFCFFPASLQDRIFYMIPLLIFPIIVVLVKRLVTWYYKKEISRSKDKLTDLRGKKKRMIDEVMDKETYKVAKEILEKFAPDRLNKSQSLIGTKAEEVKEAEQPAPAPAPAPVAIGGGGLVLGRLAGSPPKAILSSSTTDIPRPLPFSQQPAFKNQPQPPQQRRLIRPILPQNRGYMDRLIETLVGDGPSNRYALICKNCATHNGMALKEEFEYIAYRCVYCGFPNPARKRKPPAPELPIFDKQSQHSEQESEEDGAPLASGDLLSKEKVEQFEDAAYKHPYPTEEDKDGDEVVGNGVTEEIGEAHGEPNETKPKTD